MKLNVKLPLISGKKDEEPKVSNEEALEHLKKREKSEETHPEQADMRNYSALGEHYKKPGVYILVQLALAAILLIVCAVWDFKGTTALGIKLSAAVIAGYDIILAAFQDVIKKAYVRENLLVTAAAVISFCIGRETEGVLAFILLQTAYLLRDYVFFRSRSTVLSLIQPEALAVMDGGKGTPLKPGDELVIGTGMTVLADCVITGGSAYVDMSFITGNSVSQSLSEGAFVPAGSICVEGDFLAEVTAVPNSAVYRQISALLKSGCTQISETEKAIEKRMRLLVPLSLTLGVLLLIILPLTTGISLTEAFRRTATIVAIASPVGAVLAVPMAFFSGMAAARGSGAVVKNAKTFEKAAYIKAVVFNKVGALTEKNYTVTDIKTDKMDPATFLKVAAYAEANSSSKTARAIVSAYGGEVSHELVQDFHEHEGKGVSVSVDGINIILGSGNFIAEQGVAVPDGCYEGSVAHMAVNGIYAGRITLSETVTRSASDAVHRLAAFGMERLAMVSGDSRERDRLVATELTIDEYYAECGPGEKVERIKSLRQRLKPGSLLAYISTPEGAQESADAADVTIVINGLSSPASLPAADILIMENSAVSVTNVISLARRTKLLIMLQLLGFCAAKAAIMVLAAFGIAPLWFGMTIDLCISVALILSSLWLIRGKAAKPEENTGR